MTPDTVTRIVALGTITGMRSTAGPLAFALRANSPLKALFGLMAAGEMAADKTSLVGNRIDPVPLAGRAAIGAFVGGLTARRAGASTPLVTSRRPGGQGASWVAPGGTAPIGT